MNAQNDSAPGTRPNLSPLPPLSPWEHRLLAVAEKAEIAYRKTLAAQGVFKIDITPTGRGRIHSLRFEPRSGKGTETPPIYFIHGYNAVASQWIPLARRLATRHTVHTPDLLGHGLSDNPESLEDFGHAIDESLIEHFTGSISERNPGILIGNSLGGWLAIRLALAHPERVRGLILISPAGAPLPMEVYERFFSRFRFSKSSDAARFFKDLHGRSEMRALRGLPGLFAEAGHHSLGNAIGPLVHALFKRPWIEILPRLTELRHLLTAEELERLKAPLLFIWGKREKIMIPEMREWYRQHLPPQAEFVEPEEFGHCPQLDRPAELTRMIEEFVGQASRQG